MCPLQGLKMFPSPACRLTLLQVTTFCRFEYLQRNNVGQMLWKCVPCPLTKKCVVWNCALSKWQSTQWDKCHKIDMNSSKSNSYIWSLVGPPPKAPHQCTVLAGYHSVESHLFMEGGFVCEWQVASCTEGSPSAKHVRTHSRVDILQDLVKKLLGLRRLRFTNCWRSLPVISGESHPYHIQEW